VKNSGPDDFHFYWIGSTEETDNHPKSGSWETIFKKIKDYCLSHHITFLGRKSEFKEYFKAGDVFLLSSREDPFPLVCLEAAQLGLPVICFEKAGGMPEFVEQDAGFVVPFEDTQSAAAKIRILINQRNLCYSLGQNARQKVLSRHTIPVNLPKVLSCCRDISGKKPVVSIIIPNYNYGKFLEKRLDSIVNQTFKDFEIIILDDASDDNSHEIIKRFSSNHPAEILINTENSGSVFRQWYKGITIARADIIWIAESDDLSDPFFLEKMLPLMNDREVNLAYCASHVIDDEERIIEYFYQLTGYYDNLPGGNKWANNYICSADAEINDGLGIKNVIPNASAVLIRRSSLTAVNTDELYSFRCAGDWFVYLNIIRSGKIAYNSKPLNYHRRHKQSVVGRSVNKAEETIPDYFKIHKFIIENFFLTDIAFEKQTGYVLNELKNLWPDIPDEKYFELYNKQELKRCFDLRIFRLPG
jgi:glycosyltransferase involved in cell wall biosynthesis